ncbi:hypothetical protein FNW52_16990 [Flavobacterium sp. ZT3R18]|uniref:hypothetical protein n=1 Tax=Flavobacterium sp. ZT3R18 TaxID=2594429 RepID=UPI001179A457|nr:hypothetical protein [Flavobacterium sp. ZT3R18]TRX32379.1 hypothetical protein FNW52_16990 [Flavobacterium sp. ZT3R18]
MKKNVKMWLQFIVLLTTIHVYGQEFDIVEKSDTIYVRYTGGPNENKFIFPPEKNGYNDREYNFSIRNGTTIREKIIFYHSKYIRRNDMDYRKISDKKVVKKDFLKKNKNIIIGIDFFSKYEICKIRDGMINRIRVIYLIDLTEKKSNTITMYEVTPTDICPMGE